MLPLYTYHYNEIIELIHFRVVLIFHEFNIVGHQELNETPLINSGLNSIKRVFEKNSIPIRSLNANEKM